MCRVLGVSRSGYYDFYKRIESEGAKARAELSDKVVKIFENSNSTYGSLRIRKALDYGYSRSKIARIMSEKGLVSVWKKSRYKPQTTVVEAGARFAANVVNQDFNATYVGEKVGCDITYIPTDEGFLYLAVVLDFFSRKILGYAFSDSLESSIVIEAFLKAYKSHGKLDSMTYHSDRGCQYTSHRYVNLLSSLGITQSMSRSGNCYDNAITESFFSTLKVELVNRYKYQSHKLAEADISSYIDNWYNPKRIHSSIGYTSPEQFILTNIKRAA
jgi:putative transposase